LDRANDFVWSERFCQHVIAAVADQLLPQVVVHDAGNQNHAGWAGEIRQGVDGMAPWGFWQILIVKDDGSTELLEGDLRAVTGFRQVDVPAVVESETGQEAPLCSAGQQADDTHAGHGCVVFYFRKSAFHIASGSLSQDRCICQQRSQGLPHNSHPVIRRIRSLRVWPENGFASRRLASCLSVTAKRFRANTIIPVGAKENSGKKRMSVANPVSFGGNYQGEGMAEAGGTGLV